MLRRSLWVSLVPYGIGRTKPNHIAPIRARNVQMFWPEANALIVAGRRDPVSGVPDYNAVVEITRA